MVQPDDGVQKMNGDDRNYFEKYLDVKFDSIQERIDLYMKSVNIRIKWMWTLLLAVVITVFLTGCATRAEFEYTDKGFKIKGAPMSSVKAKQGDVEIEANSKFDIFKDFVNFQKVGV